MPDTQPDGIHVTEWLDPSENERHPSDVVNLSDLADRWHDAGPDGSRMHVLHLTGGRLAVVDPLSGTMTCFPRLPRHACGLFDRSPRLLAFLQEEVPLPGEPWAPTEITEAADDDPWGGRQRRWLGEVLAVRTITLAE